MSENRPERVQGESEVVKVRRGTYGRYEAMNDDDVVVAEAGALSIAGEPVAFSDAKIFFGPRQDYEVEPNTHKDGLLRIG